jgi:ATP-dependent RNA helicase DDX10/DBP4
MLAQLAEAKVPLQQLKLNPHKVTPIGPSLSALLSKNAELKAFAQSGLVSYCRSVYLQPNKAVFDAAALPVEVRLLRRLYISVRVISTCQHVPAVV